MKIHSILSLLYPPRCPICCQILGPQDGLIHKKCEKKLVYVGEPACLRCGKPVYSPVQELCLDCSRSATTVDGGISVWVYTKEMSESIAMYKYHGKREFAGFYVQQAVERCGSWIRERRPDCITAVPLNRRKLRQRGYNQAMLVAKGIGRALKIPVDGGLLVRSRYTAPQKELNSAQRLKNLQKAFGSGKSVRKYKSVLLVDDIYTTGSTMKICSEILKANGVNQVWILSLCIGSDD